MIAAKNMLYLFLKIPFFLKRTRQFLIISWKTLAWVEGRTILWLAGVNASVKMENSNYVQLFTIFAPPITQFRTRQVHSPPICSSFATYLFATARDKKNELQNHVCIFFTHHTDNVPIILKRERKNLYWVLPPF